MQQIYTTGCASSSPGSQQPSIAIAQELSVNVIELNLGLQKTKRLKCLLLLIVSQQQRVDIYTNRIPSIVTELCVCAVKLRAHPRLVGGTNAVF